MSVALAPLEDALAARGMEAAHHDLSDGAKSYLITVGSAQIELLDATDGQEFEPADLAEAIHYGADNSFREVTESFAEVETVEDFLAAIDSILA